MHFMIVITCPKTMSEVRTGIVVNIKTFEELPADGSQFQCPSCGEEHVWATSDAQLASLSPTESAGTIPSG